MRDEHEAADLPRALEGGRSLTRPTRERRGGQERQTWHVGRRQARGHAARVHVRAARPHSRVIDGTSIRTCRAVSIFALRRVVQ
eukprot:3840405-Prymnesium_polylepis.1